MYIENHDEILQKKNQHLEGHLPQKKKKKKKSVFKLKLI